VGAGDERREMQRQGTVIDLKANRAIFWFQGF